MSSKYIYYALHLYFSGLLSLRKTSEHLLPFIKRNHMYPSGIGYNIINQQRYDRRERKYRNSL
jgi:hypothetical protein